MMRALGVVWDLIVLNLLFLVCCIPVVTIGPAITALLGRTGCYPAHHSAGTV